VTRSTDHPEPKPPASGASREAAQGGRAAAPIRPYRRPPRGNEAAYLHPPYASSTKRAPARPLVLLPHTLSEVTGPVFGHAEVTAADRDLTNRHAGEPLGERIVVSGRVLDEGGRAVGGALVEIWQANAAGRYRHQNDGHRAPLDPNFDGCGRAITDGDGRWRFTSVKPGAYPWRNHPNAWRPAHIHFSVLGAAFVTRLVTQMYFPGDPLLPFDPIWSSIPDERARARLVSAFDWETTVPETALGYRFDIVLRGRDATPMER
jgi:protocatechuate 3,4-dioxygenase beta subunit